MTKKYLKPSVFWSIRQGFPRWLSLVLTVSALSLPLIIWCILSYGKIVDPIFLPTPVTVMEAGYKMFVEDDFLLDIFASSTRVIYGFLVAAFLGIPIGVAMGTFYSMDSFLGPIVGTVRYLPVVAFMPLIVLWVGLNEPAKILIVFFGIIFYNAIMIADGVKFIPDEMLNAAYTLGATRLDLLLRVILPASLPNIIDTLRVNVAGAWNFLVIAELIGAEKGLGFRIIYSQRFLQTDKVLFTIVIIGLIGLVIDFGFKLLYKLALPWADGRTT